MRVPDSVRELLRQLIGIPSVNPDGIPGTPHTGEQACAEFVGSFLESIGAEVRYDEVLPGRPNVVACFPSDAAGKPAILFAPHTDTVGVEGMTVDPFGAEVRDGKIFGRGASDTKGPMSAMLWSLREMGPRLGGLSHEIWFAGLMGEEAGQHGSHHLAKQFRPEFVIVGEPTSLKVVHAHKGCLWMTVRAPGKAVHASTPERGENAIYKIADVIRWLREVLDPDFRKLSHPTLGSPTLNPGVISGGTKPNVVPDRCTLQVDMRILPTQNPTALEDYLRTEIGSLCEGADFSFWHAAPLHTDPTHPLVTRLAKIGAGLTTAPWFCDAASFAEVGVPAVAAGPGSIDQAHTEDEFISESDLESGVNFYRSFLDSLERH